MKKNVRKPLTEPPLFVEVEQEEPTPAQYEEYKARAIEVRREYEAFRSAASAEELDSLEKVITFLKRYEQFLEDCARMRRAFLASVSPAPHAT